MRLVEAEGQQQRLGVFLSKLLHSPVGDLAIRVIRFGTIGWRPIE